MNNAANNNGDTMTSRTPAQSAKAIRRALKAELGLNARQVSVTSSSYSMGSSIHATIKVTGVSVAEVEAVANAEQHVDRCEISGDILTGGNQFVFVSYAQEVEAPVRAEVRARLDAGAPVADGLTVRQAAGDYWEICQEGNADAAYGIDSCVHQVTRRMLNRKLAFAAAAEETNAQAQWLEDMLA